MYVKLFFRRKIVATNFRDTTKKETIQRTHKHQKTSRVPPRGPRECAHTFRPLYISIKFINYSTTLTYTHYTQTYTYHTHPHHTTTQPQPTYASQNQYKPHTIHNNKHHKTSANNRHHNTHLPNQHHPHTITHHTTTFSTRTHTPYTLSLPPTLAFTLISTYSHYKCDQLARTSVNTNTRIHKLAHTQTCAYTTRSTTHSASLFHPELRVGSLANITVIRKALNINIRTYTHPTYTLYTQTIETTLYTNAHHADTHTTHM